MSGLLLITALLSMVLPLPNVGEALDEFEDGNYARAAVLLDEVARAEPDQYRFNNLHYLRGRIAEAQGDRALAESEFNQVGADSVLYDIAVWHLARLALLDGRVEDARKRVGWLPSGFPEALLEGLAELAPPPLALEIYDGLSSREARLESALLRDDSEDLWSLVRRNPNDDVAVRAARQLYDISIPPEDRILLARTYASQRAFDLAEPMFMSLLDDPELAADAHYGLGRVYFQLARYDDALGMYRATILQFPDTDPAEDAESQLAPTYWRKLDFETAAEAYKDLTEEYRSDRSKYQDAVGALIDVYRALGDNESALEWIDRGLANRPSASDRAVLIFSRAKIQYLEGAWADALDSFRALGRLDLRAVPNGTDIDEVRFFEALTLEKLDRLDEARAIWTDLARTPFSYYGMKSARKLGEEDTPGHALSQLVERSFSTPPDQLCQRPSTVATQAIVRERRLGETRQVLVEGMATNRVGELAFLHLWDEAYFWASQQANRYDDQTLADLAYLAGDYRRAMLYADRLRPRQVDELFQPGERGDLETEVLLGMLYPAPFADVICSESADSAANPLWLRSIMWQESRYDPNARSGAVARGLMQFIPETALDVADQLGMPDIEVTRSLYDPAVSVRLGAHYWSYLMDEFGTPEMALAAYNGGPQNVRRWQAKSGGADPEIFLADVGFVETKNYVRRVFELYARYAYLQASTR